MLEDCRTVTVGLDVHKSSVRLAAVRGGEVLRERTLAYDHEELLGELGAWPGARVCQEAGPTGFGLHRALLAADVDSVIVAPGLVPTRPGDRVKTDARDARRLAGLHAAGLLSEIYVPTLEHEALRDLVRAREDARLDRMRARHRLGKFLLRHERRMPTTCWGPTRRAWLGRQAFELAGQQHAFDDYLFAVDQIDRRIEALERAIDVLAKDGPHRELIARLRCMRGIDTLTAIGLVAEVGDFARFTTAEQFMSFTGLVPSERSSGARAVGRARLPRPAPLTRDGCSSKPRGTAGAARPSATSSGAAKPAKTPRSSSTPGAPSSDCIAAGSGWPGAASPTRRPLSRAPASWPGSSGRSPPNSRCAPPEPARSSVGWRAVPPRRRTLDSPIRHRSPPGPRRPVTLDRGNSRRTPVMRYSTRECQSDPPSLPRDARHPTPEPQHQRERHP